MRLSCAARAAAIVLLLSCGGPKAPATSSPAAARLPADPRIEKLALILRASDRRIVDDDLRALLADVDPSIREKAALALGQIGDRASVPDLEAAASDNDEGTKASAAFAMGLIADASTVATLRRLAGDTSARVRAAAGEALGRLRDASGAQAIGSLLLDSETPVRVAACLAAWKLADPNPFLDPLVENLGRPEPALREAAAYALARLASATSAPASSGAVVGHLSEEGVTRAREALRSRAADQDQEVRMQIARGLALPRSAEEVSAVGALSKDRDPGVRANAARSLGYPSVGVRPFLDRAAADRDQGVARAALEAIGKVGGAVAEEILDKMLLKLEAGWLREAALESLTKVNPAKTPDVVNGLMMNPDPVMRATAATLLAGRKEPGAVAAAKTLLGDSDPRVQAAAIPIVGDEEGSASTLLAGYFGAHDPVVRAAAADVVGGRLAKPQAAVEAREDLFARLEDVWTASAADSLPDAKLSVLEAYAKAGKDERTRTALERGLSDKDVVVRRRAAAKLKEVYGEDRSGDVGPAADRPLSEYEAIVRWSLVPHAAVISMRRPGTHVGRLSVALDASAAPLAAWNFAQLAGKKFFDGAVLHRVVPNFVVQDGDPRGDGFGGPGYSIRDEFNPLPFSAGVIGMASDGKDTAGSQWFITLSAQPHLDGRYTSFGRVVQGLREIAAQMRPGDTVVSIRVYEGNGTEPLPTGD